MELWDAYDEHFQKIEGVTLRRGETVPAGMFHIVVEILVRHADGTFLLMQRDPRKHFGGMWEATAGGSALQGETPMESALRELREETGIVAENLTELQMRRIPRMRTFFGDYFCETDCDKASITLQEGETVAYRWVTKEELLRMTREELIPLRMQEYVLEIDGGRNNY